MQIDQARNLATNASELERLADFLQAQGFSIAALLIGTAALELRDHIPATARNLVVLQCRFTANGRTKP
jgi:hypothetical protein